jgi:hypothetical protein
VYMTPLMLRALESQDMTAAQRRQADEQLGRIAASLARCRRRLAGRAHAARMFTGSGGQPTALAWVGASRRPAASPATGRLPRPGPHWQAQACLADPAATADPRRR